MSTTRQNRESQRATGLWMRTGMVEEIPTLPGDLDPAESEVTEWMGRQGWANRAPATDASAPERVAAPWPFQDEESEELELLDDWLVTPFVDTMADTEIQCDRPFWDPECDTRGRHIEPRPVFRPFPRERPLPARSKPRYRLAWWAMGAVSGMGGAAIAVFLIGVLAAIV